MGIISCMVQNDFLQDNIVPLLAFCPTYMFQKSLYAFSFVLLKKVYIKDISIEFLIVHKTDDISFSTRIANFNEGTQVPSIVLFKATSINETAIT